MAIEAYKNYGKDEWKTRWEVETNGTWNWDKVLEDIKIARETYEKLASTSKQDSKIHKCRNMIRKSFRSFSSHAQLLSGWLSLIPDGDYGAVVCGTLRMIFKAAARLGKVREDMMEAISQIPETIAIIHWYKEIYSNSLQMRPSILRFEVATLMALEHVLLWLTEKPICQCMPSFPFVPPSSGMTAYLW